MSPSNSGASCAAAAVEESSTEPPPAADAALHVPASAPSTTASVTGIDPNPTSQNAFIGSVGSVGENSGALPAPAPVPDALLSLAKSARYTSYLSDLLSDLVAPYLAHYHTNNGHNNVENSNGNSNGSRPNASSSSWKLIGKLKPEMDLVAALLHAMLVMWRQGRSMGMDVTGLRYCPEELLVRRRKRRTKVGGSGSGDSSESLDLAPADAQLVSPPASATLATTFVPSSLSGETKSLPEQLGTYSRSLLFVALTVLPPYLAARCGRAGGWDELKSLLFPTPSDTNDSTTASSSHTGNTQHSVEHLRGKSRREIFEERRRAMLQMASRIESGDDIGSGARGDGGGTPMHNNGESIREGGDAHTARSVAVSGRQTQRDRVRQKYVAMLRRLFRSGTDWFRQAYIATLSLPTAAHMISRNNMTEANGNNSDEQLEAQADSRASILRWILRMNLALFFLNGMYPTLAHRIAGVRLSSDTQNRSTVSSAQGLVSPGISDRPSYRMIGALILLEAGAALTGTMNRLLVDVFHRLEMRRATRRSNENAAARSAIDSEAAAAAERSRLLDLVEKRAPSVLTYEQNMQKDEGCRIERVGPSSQARQPASSSSCGICMHDRKHPAAPVSCGHVFCWSCIIHWSTRVRPECPLCRAPAKPQDIIALYNY